VYHNMKALKHKGLGLLIITAGLSLFLLTTKSFWLPFVASWLMVGDKDLQPADVIIVLSGEQGERVATGVKLYQEGLAPRLLMTGGTVEWNVAAADIMAEQAKFLGVPEKDIILEKRAASTYENVLCSLMAPGAVHYFNAAGASPAGDIGHGGAGLHPRRGPGGSPRPGPGSPSWGSRCGGIWLPGKAAGKNRAGA